MLCLQIVMNVNYSVEQLLGLPALKAELGQHQKHIADLKRQKQALEAELEATQIKKEFVVKRIEMLHKVINKAKSVASPPPPPPEQPAIVDVPLHEDLCDLPAEFFVDDTVRIRAHVVTVLL